VQAQPALELVSTTLARGHDSGDRHTIDNDAIPNLIIRMADEERTAASGDEAMGGCSQRGVLGGYCSCMPKEAYLSRDASQCFSAPLYPAHEALIWLYDHAKKCARFNETEYQTYGVPVPGKPALGPDKTKEMQREMYPDGCVGKPWADAMARYLGQAAEHGYSMFDVPYGSMPSLLKGDQFRDSMFVLMWRDVEGWVKLRMDPNLKSGEDVVCHPAFFQKLQEAGHSPMDVHACVSMCIEHKESHASWPEDTDGEKFAKYLWPTKRERCLVQMQEFEQLAKMTPRTANLTLGDNFLAHNAAVKEMFAAAPYQVHLNLFVDEWAKGHVKPDGADGAVEESEIAQLLAEGLCAHPLRTESHAIEALCATAEKGRNDAKLKAAYQNMAMVQRPAGKGALQP
jgi:hypothetical protein